MGDTLSVVYGGYARVQTLIQSGMTEEQAIKDFENQTIETQQSEYSSLTPRSRLKHRTGNRASKLAKMFISRISNTIKRNKCFHL